MSLSINGDDSDLLNVIFTGYGCLIHPNQRLIILNCKGLRDRSLFMEGGGGGEFFLN
jgi:hypothetical protein